MIMLKRFLAACAVLGLAACGGGGGSSAGTPPFGNGASAPGSGGATGTASVADLTIQLSSNTIVNSSTGPVTATITAVDANRNAVPNAAVAVSANANAVVTIAGNAGSTTNGSGVVLAAVSLGSDTSNRAITVTAAANGITRTAVLNVVSGPVGNSPTSIEVLSANPSIGTGGDGVVIRAFVKDANNNTLASAPVSFTASSGTLSAVSTTTDAAGVATATFSAGANRANRNATITVSSGTVSAQLVLPVTGTRLTLSGPSSLILGNSTFFDVVVADSNGNVIPGVAVAATSALNNAVTAVGSNVSGSGGQVRFSYAATNPGSDTLVFTGAGISASPSPALVVIGQDFAFVSPVANTTVPVGVGQIVQVRLRSNGVAQAGQSVNFAATGGALSQTSAVTDASGVASVTLTSQSAGPVTVQATVTGTSTTTTLPVTVVATVPASLVLQVSPTSVAPNTGGSTANQAQAVARVTDAQGNPVAGRTVNFTRLSDPSGGNLLQASATTDTSGQATVTYRAGGQSTANNGVRLRAEVAGLPTVGSEATLTVNQTALFIALGTGNVITNLDPQTYRKDWVVYVTDSNGVPVNGVSLTVKAIPVAYLTGRLAWNGTRWAYSGPINLCRNEDRGTAANPGGNGNGVLDQGEDDNLDGFLWPGNVIAVTPGTVQVSGGRATISLTYAESYAPWVSIRLTASALVTGTESSTGVDFIVTGAAEDFTVETVPPAGVVSPFGAAPRSMTVPGACVLQ